MQTYSRNYFFKCKGYLLKPFTFKAKRHLDLSFKKRDSRIFVDFHCYFSLLALLPKP